MSNARRFVGPLLLAGAIALVVPTSAQQPNSQQGLDQPSAQNDQAPPDRITHKQLENLQARIAKTQAIINRLQPDATSLGRSNGWRQASIDSLLGLSLSALERVEREASSADSLAAVVADAADDPQVFGDTDQDLVYFPIVPCRYGDTRNVGGRINGIRGFDISFNGATYGGLAACDPTAIFGVGENSFSALALNVTLVDPTASPGFVAVKPTAGAAVTSLLNWYETGATVQAANLGIVTLDQTGTLDEYVVQTSAPVHIIQDIFGAFLAPHATALQVTSVTTAWSTVAISTSFSVLATCPAGYTISGGGWNHNFGNFDGISATQSSREGNGWRCRGWSTDGGTESGYCEALCSRVPGR